MSQRINLDVTPGLFTQVLHLHQGDVGRQFQIKVVTRDGYEIPSGATFKIEGTKPSDMGFSVTGTASDNVITFTTTTEMTDEAGNIPAQLRITSGGTVIFASNFLMSIEANAHPDTVVDGSIDQFIPEMTLLVERLEAAAATVEDAASLAPRISAAEGDIDTLEARFDQFIAPTGEAPNAAEITDARVGDDGVTYTTLGTAIRTQVSDLKSDLYSVYNLPVDGNFFNVATAILNKDINSSTGALVNDNRYSVSDKIVMDFTQRVRVVNSTYKYVYCYASDDSYLGRIDTSNSSSAPATAYPTVAYVRILYKNTDTNVMVLYHKYYTTTYMPFLPIGGWTDNSVSKHNYPADAKGVRDNFVAINPIGGNLFNYDTRIDNTTPDSTTGVLRSDTGYFCSQKIYIDGASKVFIKGSTASTTYQYAYCYKADDTFLGRYNCNSGTVLNTATGDAVAYIRVIGTMATDKRIQVLQVSAYYGNQYRPYSEIAKYSKPLESKKIRVANYNTGDFTGVGIARHSQESIDTYRKEVQTFDADLITYEYDIANVNDISAYDNILAKWLKTGTKSGSTDYNYYAMRTMFDVISTEKVNYTITSAVTPTHTSFLATVFLINFIPVCVIALHVDWKDKYLRGEQLDSVLNYCDSYENVIITGDFNPEDYINGVKQSNNLTYEDLDRFIEAGYTPLNANSDLLGVVPTLASDSQIGAWDNILIKGADIKPCSFGAFKRESWMNDHIPIYADLVIG